MASCIKKLLSAFRRRKPRDDWSKLPKDIKKTPIKLTTKLFDEPEDGQSLIRQVACDQWLFRGRRCKRRKIKRSG